MDYNYSKEINLFHVSYTYKIYIKGGDGYEYISSR